MMTTIRDVHGHITATCEWVPIDRRGHQTNDYTLVYVNQVELSAGVDPKTAIREVILDIATRAPAAEGAYWERRDSTGVGQIEPHYFTRRRLLAYANRLSEEVRV